MATVNSFTLISGGCYCYRNLVKIHPPKLGKIRDIGWENYQALLSALLSNAQDLIDAFGLDNTVLGALPTDSLIFITSFPLLRERFLEALSFFVEEKINYDDETGYFVGGGEAELTLDDMREIRSVILQLCCLEDSVTPPKKFRNEKAKKIYELIQQRKAEQAKAMKGKHRENPDTALPNLLSSFCAFSPSYNLTNVWDLTIYQFYDQYHRLDAKIQLDVYGLRWAAWGKKEFDFSVWHKAPLKK